MQRNVSWYGGWFLMMILLVSGCAPPTPQELITPEEACKAYEKEIHDVSLALAESLTGAMKNAIAVVDFIDPEGTVTDLSLALADAGKGFWVVSGPYLRKMLKSQQLSEVVLKENPQAARTLWQVMGIEAFITGTLESRGEMIRLSLKISNTDTTEAIGECIKDITKKDFTREALPPQTRDLSQIPKFPWPPPEASASAKIPSEFLVEDSASLKDVATRIEKAFNQAGYGEKSFYRVPDGFAMISRMEQFYPDGTPKELPDRWAAKVKPPRNFSLKSYLEALFTPQEGHYRIIVFIVTSQPFGQTPQAVTPDEANAWLAKGSQVLPATYGELPYTDNHYCIALIYEFEQATRDHEVIFKEMSELHGIDHLKKSQLWEALGE
jgi:hypothetical protein